MCSHRFRTSEELWVKIRKEIEGIAAEALRNEEFVLRLEQCVENNGRYLDGAVCETK